ncbi:MAG: hypothetical protein WAU56_07570 [Steroidobacteraceae bacterium]
MATASVQIVSLANALHRLTDKEIRDLNPEQFENLRREVEKVHVKKQALLKSESARKE